MDKIKVTLDRELFWNKPTKDEIPKISSRIGSRVKKLTATEEDMKKFAELVGIDGRTFCTATFKDGKRSKENFEQQQFFALDFDNKDPKNAISLEEVKQRAEHYDLPVLFAYDTFSSTEHNKFRVVFLNDAPIPHRKVAEAMQLALGTIFPESDQSCYNDIARMYFGGKELRHFDKRIPTINVESVFRNLTYFMKDKYKANHYKDYLSKFSRTTGIALNKNGLLDVMVSVNSTEDTGVSELMENGKFSPNAFIYNIKANGEKFPNLIYQIKLTDYTNWSSVDTSVDKTDVSNKKHIANHKYYRKEDIDKIRQVCRLYQEFENGTRNMEHYELFGMLNNLINIESGTKKFVQVLSEHPEIYDAERIQKWEKALSFNKQAEYKPTACDGYCPYCNECNHGSNILSTARPKAGMMERIPGYHEVFSSIEDVQDDTFHAIEKAFHAKDKRIHIVKSMTGAGKSTSYLRLMEENPGSNFLIATPTNLLKNEIYKKAKKMDIDVKKTPSLEQIQEEIPSKVWKHIQWLYKMGRGSQVTVYIDDLLQKHKEDDAYSSLRKYINKHGKLKFYQGNLITTHRYLLNMSEKRLQEYDAIIIDEDIIFKSIIPNQEEITISGLEKLLEEVTNSQLVDKIEKLLKLCKKQSYIELDAFDWDQDEDEDISIPFDIPSFCSAEYFYLRKASKEDKLTEDTIAFLKPAKFWNLKYIMVSATADETICNNFFGTDRVDFYECKRAAYIGTLHQYPGKSMSRSSIESDEGIIDRITMKFGIDSDRLITFKCKGKGNLHFGNTEGSNELEGKDILVIGTPYHADFLYRLAAFTMGLDFNEDEEVELQIVKHNGYRFRFTTFKNEDLQALQFWMIESELEQAVGRARLLRNPCEVHLFSNFPLRQAKMVDDFDYGKSGKKHT